jgi:hypothetical protein
VRLDGRQGRHGRFGAFVLAWLLAAAAPGCNAEPAQAESPNALPDAAVVVELVFVVRVNGNGDDARLEVPLPLAGETVQILDESFRLRGFTLREVVDDGVRMAILEHPALEGPRRFTYKALIALDPIEHPVVSPRPGEPPGADLRRWTLPTPRLQSRSPLVRERLIEHLEPRLEAGEDDMVRLLYGLVAGHFERRTSGGTSNVLRAVREGHANDLGLDRLLVTFMRASGIPARNVGGFRLRTDGGRKLERWTEIHVGGRWVPMSVPKSWYGTQPPQYLRLYHGERRLIERDGVESLSFKVLVRDPRPPDVSAETALDTDAGSPDAGSQGEDG